MGIVDAKNMVLGRMATAVAERLLGGEHVTIINAEKAVISGSYDQIRARFKKWFDISPKGNSLKGPKYSKMPDRIVRRAVRGMLPFKKPRGKAAFKRLSVHIAVPKELEGVGSEKIPAAENRLKSGYVTVGEISKSFGVRLGE